jgi:hypothetical protein
MKRRKPGPGAESQIRVSALYDSLKKAGRRGTYLSALLQAANERLPENQQIRSLSHLHFLLFGWPKKPTSVQVGGYLAGAVEAVPGTPRNVTYIRLKPGVRKKDVHPGPTAFPAPPSAGC